MQKSRSELHVLCNEMDFEDFKTLENDVREIRFLEFFPFYFFNAFSPLIRNNYLLVFVEVV